MNVEEFKALAEELKVSMFVEASEAQTIKTRYDLEALGVEALINFRNQTVSSWNQSRETYDVQDRDLREKYANCMSKVTAVVDSITAAKYPHLL